MGDLGKKSPGVYDSKKLIREFVPSGKWQACAGYVPYVISVCSQVKWRCVIDGIDRTMRWCAALPTPASGRSNICRCEQHPRQHRCQHANDAAETGYSHMAERSARSSLSSCRRHAAVDRC